MILAAMIKNPTLARKMSMKGAMKLHTKPVSGFKKQLQTRQK